MKFLRLVAFALLCLGLACGEHGALPLAGTSWTLGEMGYPSNLQEISSSDPVVLEFLSDNKIKGYTGCNSYAGTYQVSGSSFKVDFMITEAGCLSRELYDREYEFKHILWDAQSVVLGDSMLTIESRDGRTLIFGPKEEGR